MDYSCIVVGAGASGMMAAARAAERGETVLLLEKMEQPGKKLLISGKGRCNLTNCQDLEDFIPMYGPNGRFLYSAFHRFFRDDLLNLLGRYGVMTTVERGGRIFPVSGSASDVVRALRRYLTENRVRLLTRTAVKRILTKDGKVSGVETVDGKFFPTRAVVLATGGASYPSTGSTGDGYRMASALGHHVVPLRPSLVPLIVEESSLVASMQGVSLKNVRLTAYRCRADEIDSVKRKAANSSRSTGVQASTQAIIDERFGEMMMTHFGIGGPITLQMSLAVIDALKNSPVSVTIDLKPGLTEKQLDLRLQHDFSQHGKRSLRRIVHSLLPAKMVNPFLEICGVSGNKPGHQVSAEERHRMVKVFKCLKFNIKGSLPLAAAMVTAGGVSLKEVDPRTMQSKLVKGLYFCGEVLDIDGNTGGYNLQAAFSTGWLAGDSVAMHSLQHGR